jgi:hypothetical protein
VSAIETSEPKELRYRLQEVAPCSVNRWGRFSLSAQALLWKNTNFVENHRGSSVTALRQISNDFAKGLQLGRRNPFVP